MSTNKSKDLLNNEEKKKILDFAEKFKQEIIEIYNNKNIKWKFLKDFEETKIYSADYKNYSTKLWKSEGFIRNTTQEKVESVFYKCLSDKKMMKILDSPLSFLYQLEKVSDNCLGKEFNFDEYENCIQFIFFKFYFFKIC
jgi:hypothetical protein